MGQIKPKQSFGVIGLDNEKEHITYCPECLKVGLKSVLKDRIYSITDEPNHDKWKQCWICGLIAPIYELNKESKITDIVELSDNPWDQVKNITGLGNRKRKLTESRKNMKRQKDIIEKEKDEDIKRELAKGNIVDKLNRYTILR